jgi:hypothetical protein
MGCQKFVEVRKIFFLNRGRSSMVPEKVESQYIEVIDGSGGIASSRAGTVHERNSWWCAMAR